ncbi:hypothetical protein J2129_000808 [Methanofollis sp. W23]|nr:hypothetical protein [Methanofollis sp. W23]
MTALMILVLIAGCVDDSNSYDIGVVRTNTEGETLWDQNVDSGYGDHLHWTSSLQSDVVSMPDGKVFVGYRLYNRPSSDPSMHMGWITCLGPDGEKIWDWSMESKWPAAYAPTSDGGCIVVPHWMKSLVKIGPGGKTEWTVFASAILEQLPPKKRPTDASISSIASTDSGHYLVGGGFKKGLFCARIDENGTVMDVKEYSGPKKSLPGIKAIVPMKDGGWSVVGGSYEKPGLARLDAHGEILWNATLPYSPSEFRGVRENGEGGLEVLVEEVERDTISDSEYISYDPDGTMHNIVYSPDGAIFREETFAILPECPITWATDRGYVVAALMHDEGDLGYFASFDSSSYVHLIKYDETGRQEWDRTVGSEPDMYHVVTINAVGEDGYVVVGERVKERSFFDILDS